ncbi:kinesin-like protein KIN-12E isoform X2 [Nymphaea colorata]|uniref:kinesin-like protein KIN-12E isoform X2 n=1 Tax=Nymphaea colorata TaxID=210225 RepID=UPI00214E09D2|nr:kinesin-like protein KIN-12E isoform X2 [Nymphaea colorata]
MSEFRITGRNVRPQRSENESENVVDLPPFPPMRTPFSDYNQNPRSGLDHESTKLGKTGVSEIGSNLVESLPLANRGSGLNLTPRSCRGKLQFEPNSGPNTPTRCTGRLSTGCFAGGGRNNPQSGSKGGILLKTTRGISSCAPASPGVEVPHFALEEDGSFWTDHNVQVLLRIRPISKMEKELHGNSRCLKQENAHTVTWLGNPDTRFTFDHIAGETIIQDMLFKVAGLPMVENCMSGYNSCMFAYGQTGSGKTYTMMGELYDANDELSEDRGMTPRIFEYLFARTKLEESSRKDEKLKYSCKCSFLEIYNEQITDLLEPSSTNLQLREDLKKGVYVENLRELEVETVKDVLDLLFQGTANRKVAATSMNSESSRSHSVFTCVIESRWEKDGMTHFRFARLNLVDLAGSERQKSSGADGERLREAANINKSLSTLGLVIMTLVDVAHGKHRHVPYRDSRLTFLLQDSLGGNSKTTIIANVSPSISCAHETLSTLKFAQRAKLIQNNAKVNEDASGDVVALQRQIQELKDQLSFLEHQNIRRPLSFHSSSFCYEKLNGFLKSCGISHGDPISEVTPINDGSSLGIHISNKKLEAMLVGSLRREKMAETTVMQLKAEMEQMNRLCNEREEDSQRMKATIRHRDEKIRRLELLADSLQPADEFLMEENIALRQEIQFLQAKIDRNPELTQFALENIRLLEQLRMLQDFYEKGEKEILLAEVSELRNQLLDVFDKRDGQARDMPNDRKDMDQSIASQEKESLRLKVLNAVEELEDIKKSISAAFKANTRLAREVDELFVEVKESLNSTEPATEANPISRASDKDKIGVDCNDWKQIREKYMEMEKTSQTTNICKENMSHKNDRDCKVMASSLELEELLNAKEEAWSLLETLEAQQVHLVNELADLREENSRNLGTSSVTECKDMFSLLPPMTFPQQVEVCSETFGPISKNDTVRSESKQNLISPVNIENMNMIFEDIEKQSHQSSLASQPSDLHEMGDVCERLQEADQMVLNLQAQITVLQHEIDKKSDSETISRKKLMLLRTENEELQNKLSLIIQENTRLTKVLEDKEEKFTALAESEKEADSLINSLMDGCHALEDASGQVSSILDLFPERKIGEDEQVTGAIMAAHEKEKVILDLQTRLESAQKIGYRTNTELSCLKEAIMAITNAQMLENVEKCKEAMNLRMSLHDKMCLVHILEDKIKHQQAKLVEANRRANASFAFAGWLLNMNALEQKNKEGAHMHKPMMDTLHERISKWNQNGELSEAVLYIQSMQRHTENLEKEVEELKLALSTNNIGMGEGQEPKAYAEEKEKHKLQSRSESQKYCIPEDLISFSHQDIEKSLTSLVCEITHTFSFVRQSVEDLFRDACDVKGLLRELTDGKSSVLSLVTIGPHTSSCNGKLKDYISVPQFPQTDLTVINEKLIEFSASVEKLCCKLLPSETLADSGKQAGIETNCWPTVDKSAKVAPVTTVSSIEPHALKSAKNSRDKLMQISFAVEKDNVELLTQPPYTSCSSTIESLSLIPQIEGFHSNHSNDEFNLKNVCHNCQNAVEIKKEFESTLIKLRELLPLFKMPYNEKTRTQYIELYGSKDGNIDSIGNQHTGGSNIKQTEHRFLEAEDFVLNSKQRMGGKDVFCRQNSELPILESGHAASFAAERSNEAQSLLMKFGEAQETMKEADDVLNALLDAYEAAKHETVRWKKLGEDLMVEKAALIQQVQELKDSIQLKEQEYANIEDHFQTFMSEANDSLSLFENFFIHIKKSSSEFSLIHSDVSTFIQKLLVSIRMLNSSTESVSLMILENKFALSTINHCLLDFTLQNTSLTTADSDCFYLRHSEVNGLADSFGETSMPTVKDNRKIEVINDTGKGVKRGCSESKLHVSECMGGMDMAEHVQSSSNREDTEVDVIFSSKRLSLENAVEHENGMAALLKDVRLMQDIINHLFIYLDRIGPCVDLLENVSANEKLAGDGVKEKLLKTNSVSAEFARYNTRNDVKEFHEVDRSSSRANDRSVECQAGLTLEEAPFLVDFQSLKNQCADLLVMLCGRSEDGHTCPWWRSSTAKQGQENDGLSTKRVSAFSNSPISSELCVPIVRGLINLGDKLNHLADSINPTKPNGSNLDVTSHKVEKLFQDICNIERKMNTYHAKISELDKQTTCLLPENLLLSKGLNRRDLVMEGLLFDLKLLQESKSDAKDRKDEAEEMSETLRKTRNDLAIKAANIDGILARQQKIEEYLTDKETAVAYLQSELADKQEALELMSRENAELRILLDDLYVKKHDFEEQLVEQQEVIESLKKEIVHISSTVEQKIVSSLKVAEDELHKVITERDSLHAELAAISGQLETALSLADENEAMAIEAQQVSEASKIHAEQKEEEARVLEQSVEELEHTINMLETKVYEMSKEVEIQKLVREELELELQDLKLRVLKTQNDPGSFDCKSSAYHEEGKDNIISRYLEERRNELMEAKRYIRMLQNEKEDQAEQIAKYQAYISELVLHSEAQASQFQEKYKALEAMACDAQHRAPMAASAAKRTEKTPVRTRASGSPFKCITGLVNQMHSDREHELHVARRRMEELESLAANRQKEVCSLNARLAVAESMTHDVIRDLLGVKLDLSTYASLLDQQVVQKLAETAQRQREENRSKEDEILMLRGQLDDFMEERERLIEENNQKKSEVLDSQVKLEQLKHRQQLLTAQNELLQMDKQNLKKKVEELDEAVKSFSSSHEIQQSVHHHSKYKENRQPRVCNDELDKRLKNSEKILSHVKDELAHYRIGRGGKAPAFGVELLKRT